MTEVDKYISGFPKDIQIILEKIRSTIKTAAPKAEEVISYGVPAFKYNGDVAYYAAFKNHIGFYPPVPESYKKAAVKYANPKGNLRFPFDQPIPYDLITMIVKYRMEENAKKGQFGKQQS